MPLPLIPVLLGAAALGAAGYGAKKGYDGYCDTKEAQRYHERAENLFDSTNAKLKESKKTATNEFEKLGKIKARIVEGSLKQYQVLIEKLDIDYQKNIDEVLQSVDFESIASFNQELITIQMAVGGLLSSGTAGAMAGFGAYGAVGLLGTASTGTAIGSLSGVAATNATLAWLGGGSLAAGGFGMAGGTLVLGGIVAAPIIAVAGSIFASMAEDKKYDARSYYHSVKALSETMQAEALLWNEIHNKTKEQMLSIRELDDDLRDVIYKVEEIAHAKGYKVKEWSEEEFEILKQMIQISEAMVNIVKSPILSDNDTTTQKIISLQKECVKLNEEIEEKWS
ncbi:hypothetical protein L8W50_05330 [Campylobacter lari]|nr:hypothetical protein [Campylobacter lari]MCV3440357.1 hypothetical protein [Campylobacter lari]HEC1757697.1 hypothetical protein [Campylobacter lari]